MNTMKRLLCHALCKIYISKRVSQTLCEDTNTSQGGWEVNAAADKVEVQKYKINDVMGFSYSAENAMKSKLILTVWLVSWGAHTGSPKEMRKKSDQTYPLMCDSVLFIICTQQGANKA